MNEGIGLSRVVLKEITADLRTHLPAIKLRDAWVWQAGKDHWEFHYKDFFWHGSAENAYDARGKGYAGLLRQAGIEGYADEPVPDFVADDLALHAADQAEFNRQHQSARGYILPEDEDSEPTAAEIDESNRSQK